MKGLPAGKKNICGQRIRLARTGKGPSKNKMTQIDLAAQLQARGIMLDRLHICRIEKANRPVSDIELIAIAEILNVSVSWLLYDDSDQLSTIESIALHVSES